VPRIRRVRRATLTSQIEESLRADIIDGVLPAGARLTAADLTERYEVSPTPLREALQRLAAENLVDLDPRLGATVARISRAHLRDTYRVRGVLESLAVADSVQRGDEAWEERLRNLFTEFELAVARARRENLHPVLSWSRAHQSFHDGLMANCDSVWLKSFLGMLNAHSERYRVLAAQTGVRDPVNEHRAIFEAALARDTGGTVAALQRHLLRTVEVIEESLPVDDDLPVPLSRL